MNIIKNFFKRFIKKETLAGACIATKDWVLSLNAMKVTAIIVVNCFLLTAVYGQAVAGLLENNRATEQFKQVFEDFDLPYSYGKITSADYRNSDTVVINIQDLHSHPEVQRNINNIISLFDEKYGVKNVYLEGAYGQVSTKWLTVAKDDNIKNAVMNKLLENGRLTGAEYFSASKGKTEIIKGLENKEAYFDNLKRFGALIDNQETITLHIDSIKDTVKQLQEQYYNRQQKKIEELSAGYVSGTIEANKYFALMKKHAEKLAVDIDMYPNLSMYLTLLEKQKEINYQKTTQELQMFVVKLKESLPYNAYKMLLSETKNFSQMDKLYGYMIKLSRQYNLDLSGNFRELEKFFAYIELSQAINPLELIKEEQNFKDEINDRFSENKAEEDVVFLSSFVRYYQDYLTGKITTDDCKYYQQNIDRFKQVWVKYIDNREIVDLSDYEQMSDTFYKINFERNHYFIDNMRDVLDGNKIEGVVEGKDELQKTMNSLQQAKEVYVTVTGGFHTQEMAAMLSRAGITNIVITPNVTGDTKVAEETYYKIAQEQAKISFQALAALNMSQALGLDDSGAIKGLIEALKDIKDLQQISEYISQETGKNINITYDETAKTFIATVNQKTLIYDVNADKWNDFDSGPATGMQKSVGSVKLALRWAAAIAGISAFSLFFIPFGFFPLVVTVGVFFGANTLNLVNQKAALKEALETAKKIAKSKMAESDGTDFETFTTMFYQLPEGTQKALLEALGCASIEEAETKVKFDADGTTGELFSIAERAANGQALSQEEKEAGQKDFDIYDIENEDELNAYASEKILHVNVGMLKAFMESGNVKNKRMLDTFIKHEIAHLNFAYPSGALKFVKEIIHKVPWLEEVVVSLGDLRRYIQSIFTTREKAARATKKGQEKKYTERFTEEQLSILEKVVKRDIIPAYDKSSDQSLAQIKFAEQLANPEGMVAILGTSGGKTLGAAIAIWKQILNNQEMLDNKALEELGKILFTSKTPELIQETMETLAMFFSAPEIIATLPQELRERAANGTLIGFVNQSQKTGYFITVKRDKNGNIVKKDGEVQFEKRNVSKQEVYSTAGIICGEFAGFTWDIQGNNTAKDVSEYLLEKLENGKRKTVPFDIFIDETQLVRENSNLSTSSGESERAMELEPLVSYIADELVGEDKVIDSSWFDKLSGQIKDSKRRGLEKIYSELIKDERFAGLNITFNEFSERVEDAVSARYKQRLETDYDVIAVDKKTNDYYVVRVDGDKILFCDKTDTKKIVATIDRTNYKTKVVINGVEYNVQIGVREKNSNNINPSVKFGNGMHGAVERVASSNGLLPSDFKYTVATKTTASDTGVSFLRAKARSVHGFTGSEEAAENLAQAQGIGVYNANAGGTKALNNNMDFVETREEQMDIAIHRALGKYFGIFTDANGMPEQSGIIFVEPSAVNKYYARMFVQMVNNGYMQQGTKISKELQQLIDANNDLINRLIEAKKKGNERDIEDIESLLDENSAKIVRIVSSSKDLVAANGVRIADLINVAEYAEEIKDKLANAPLLAIATNIASTGMDVKYKGIKGVFTIDANDQRTKENDYQTAGRGTRSVKNPSTSDKICSREQIMDVDYLDADKISEYDRDLRSYVRFQQGRKDATKKFFQNLVRELLKDAKISETQELKDSIENIADEVDVMNFVRHLEAGQRESYKKALVARAMKERKSHKEVFKIDFEDIFEYASEDLQVLQILSYLNQSNLYNDVEAKRSNKGFYRRDRNSNTETSGLVNLLSLIEDEKAQNDDSQANDRDMGVDREKRSSSVYNGIDSQRVITKDRYMDKDNWISNMLRGNRTLSDEDLIKLGKLYQKKQGQSARLSNAQYIQLGREYLEKLRGDSIDAINNEYSFVQYSIEAEKRAINDMYSNKILSRF